MDNDDIANKIADLAMVGYVEELITWEEFVEIDDWIQQAWERGRDK